jgi:hypothetical protein
MYYLNIDRLVWLVLASSYCASHCHTTVDDSLRPGANIVKLENAICETGTNTIKLGNVICETGTNIIKLGNVICETGTTSI